MLVGYGEEETRSPEELRVLRKQADQEAQTELGPALEFVVAGDVATTDHLLSELSIAERLEDMIDRCLKRLLMVKGLIRSFFAGAHPQSCLASGEQLGRL